MPKSRLRVTGIVLDCKDGVINRAWESDDYRCLAARLSRRAKTKVNMYRNGDCVYIDSDGVDANTLRSVVEEIFVVAVCSHWKPRSRGIRAESKEAERKARRKEVALEARTRTCGCPPHRQHYQNCPERMLNGIEGPAV